MRLDRQRLHGVGQGARDVGAPQFEHGAAGPGLGIVRAGSQRRLDQRRRLPAPVVGAQDRGQDQQAFRVRGGEAIGGLRRLQGFSRHLPPEQQAGVILLNGRQIRVDRQCGVQRGPGGAVLPVEIEHLRQQGVGGGVPRMVGEQGLQSLRRVAIAPRFTQGDRAAQIRRG